MKNNNDIKETVEDIFKMKNYPKHQYSIFTQNGKNEQFVIRAESVDELVEEKRELDEKILNPLKEKRADKPTPKSIAPKPTEMSKDDPKHLTREHCLVHNVKMNYYEKEGKSWYSHSKDDEKKVWCSGNGWKE